MINQLAINNSQIYIITYISNPRLNIGLKFTK